MTLVAAAQYPRILDESYTGSVQGIIMVSDSRITDFKEYKDIAQKIHQISREAFYGFAGNVKLAEEVTKTIHYHLDQKNMKFDGLAKFNEHFSETIKFKRGRLGDVDTDFLFATLNDNNIPELYYFSRILEYRPYLIGNDYALKIIGQDSQERDQLEKYIYEAIKDLKANEYLDCCSAMRKAMTNYIKETNKYPIRKTVGGLFQAMSVRPHPVEVENLNYMKIDLVTNDVEITKFDNEGQEWIQDINGTKTGTTSKYPFNKFYEDNNEG